MVNWTLLDLCGCILDRTENAEKPLVCPPKNSGQTLVCAADLLALWRFLILLLLIECRLLLVH
jgi:hypothetical protein